MGVKYCGRSGCGGRTDYTVKVPAFCSSCGQPFAAAFSAAKPIPVSTPTSPFLSTRSATARPQHEQPLRDGEESDDRYDKDEVYEMARELAASVSSDVELVTVGGGKHFSLKDVLDSTKSVDAGVRGTVQTQLPPQ